MVGVEQIFHRAARFSARPVGQRRKLSSSGLRCFQRSSHESASLTGVMIKESPRRPTRAREVEILKFRGIVTAWLPPFMKTRTVMAGSLGGCLVRIAMSVAIFLGLKAMSGLASNRPPCFRIIGRPRRTRPSVVQVQAYGGHVPKASSAAHGHTLNASYRSNGGSGVPAWPWMPKVHLWLHGPSLPKPGDRCLQVCRQ